MMAPSPKRPARGPGRAVLVVVSLVLLPGCQGIFTKHNERRVPDNAVIDPQQPRELQMVSQPPYVVEPPDQLEVAIRPSQFDLPASTVTVQVDGTIDLGFVGSVYVAGLTLDGVEEKVRQQIVAYAHQRNIKPTEPIEVSVRLSNGTQSKVYYVLGTVTTQGRFPMRGDERVLDALLTAGLRSNSLPDRAYLVRPRPVGLPDLILRIDWEGIKQRGDTLTNYQIFPGDRIIVPGNPDPGLFGTFFGGFGS